MKRNRCFRGCARRAIPKLLECSSRWSASNRITPTPGGCTRKWINSATKWRHAGTLAAERAQHLRALTGELRSIYKTHIEMEDTRLFPLAERVLDRAAQAEIGREMAARRSRQTARRRPEN